ncbi:uncharacterized protein LOC107809737 [Nicotiana tabacum]|uniref:Uncharacterized protein LOC107809737 n=1 Tax=Nicotiana tabacum TaxID=4097 RepID=A0A1S4BLX8_TOBAC|nr:PREDICTED: uncharacterized protein LOC107809737 [Nicotiana tabacum]
MNRFAYQQTAFVGCVGVGDMRRGDISVCGAVVCPKPRRIGLFDSSYVHSDERIRSSRSEACDLKAGTELLDIILTKGNYDEEKTNFEMASSPPFYFGSPPSRVSNPLIQDSQFSNDNFVPILAIPDAAAAPSPPPSFTSASAAVRKNGGGCVPVKYGNKQAAVRIEGFNCRSSISAVA